MNMLHIVRFLDAPKSTPRATIAGRIIERFAHALPVLGSTFFEAT